MLVSSSNFSLHDIPERSLSVSAPRRLNILFRTDGGRRNRIVREVGGRQRLCSDQLRLRGLEIGITRATFVVGPAKAISQRLGLKTSVGRGRPGSAVQMRAVRRPTRMVTCCHGSCFEPVIIESPPPSDHRRDVSRPAKRIIH